MKKLLCFSLAAAGLCAEPLIESELPPPEPVPMEEKTSFTYLNLGGSGIGFFAINPDISFGRRALNSHHAWDANIGVCPLDFGMVYGQTSYLYFPEPSQGSYFGVGITAGISRHDFFSFFSGSNKYKPYLNFPVTLGYQMESHHFVQVQLTPLFTGTVSYGIGF